MVKKLGIKAQIGISFAVVVGLFAVTLLVVWVLLSNLTQDVRQIAEKTLPNALVADEMNLSRSEVQQFLTDVSATHDRAGYKNAEASARRFHRGVEKFKQLYRHENDVQNLQKMELLEADFNKFYAVGSAMAKTYIDKGMEAGNLLMKGSDGTQGFDKASEIIQAEVAGFRQQQVAEADKKSADALGAATHMKLVLLLSSMTAALLSAILGALIARSILQQLGGEPGEAVNVARHVGAGDLSLRIDLKPGDTTSLMAQLKGHAGKPGHCRLQCSPRL